MRRWFIAAMLMMTLLVCSSAFGQVNAVLSGTVSDASGALIPGVEVTAKNVNTGITDTRLTNESGNFVFPSLQPGTYTLAASLSGFRTASYNNVVLGQGQQVRLNFNLQVGAAAQNVEVTISADTLLATTSASVGNVLADKELLSLPLSTRNVLDVLASTSGVVYTTNAFGAQVPNFGGTSVGSVNTTRDGLVTNDGRYNASNGAYSAIFTSPDMVEEVRVSSNNIDPSLGRGAAQVQMRTRAGTNDFHGAVFYSNNNSFLNSQTYFQNLQHAAKNYANRNQFGGRVGGPIIKNKMFFFFLTDDQRYMGKLTQNTAVLTDLAKQGIFRYSTTHRNGAVNSTQPSVDVNGNPLPGEIIRSFNLFSDVKDPNRTGIDQTFIAKYYLPNSPSPNNYQCTTATGAAASDGLNTGCFQWLQPQNGSDGATGQSPNTNRNHLTLRYDYQINSKNKVTFTMTREKNWGVTGQTGLADVPAGGFGDVFRTPNFYTAQYTSTISSNILNEFRFGRKQDTWLGTSPLDKGCCLFGASESDRTADAQKLYNAYPQIDKSFLYPANPTGFSLAFINNFGVASPRITTSPFTQWADTVSFTKGAHSFSAGFEMDFTSSKAANTGNTQTTRPQATLGINSGFPSSIATTQPYAAGLNTNDVATANNILAVLSGSINQLTETFYINSPTQQGWTNYQDTIFFKRAQHENDWNLFFKDNWKATKNLTLIFGMRYDKYGVVYDEYGLAGRYTSKFGSGAGALFGCSGNSFAVWWQPGAGDCGSASPTITATEFVGKDSPSPDKLVHPNDWNNFAPSMGFSWAVPRLRNTVIRGGYGINYSAAPDFLAYNSALGSFPGNALNVTSTTFNVAGGYLDLAKAVANQKALFPLSTSGTLPFQPLPLNGAGSRTGSISGYADDWKTPYIQSFNLSIQRELTNSLTFDVGWVGNHALHLQNNHQINDVNVQENGLLAAFNAVRAGQDNVPLMEQIFKGVNFGGTVGTVGVNGLTAAQALRRSTTTNGMIANGNVGAFANLINNNQTLAPAPNNGKPGGLLLNAGLPQNFIVVSPQYGTVNLIDQYGFSTYHSLQTHVTKRPTHGLGGQLSYTFSKALGNDSIRNPRNIALSKTVLNVDRTHVIAGNWTYDLPFGANHWLLANAPGWAQRVVGGWQLASITSWQSGAPLSFNATGVTTLYNSATNTVDQLAALPKGAVTKGNNYVSFFDTLSTKKITPTFNSDNATLQGVYTNQVLVDGSGNILMQDPNPGFIGTMTGNSGVIRGPGMLSFNAAVTKSVRLTENKTFTLRADVVNVLNKPQWGNPNTSINGTTFGRITSVVGGTQRLVTINARIDF